MIQFSYISAMDIKEMSWIWRNGSVSLPVIRHTGINAEQCRLPTFCAALIASRKRHSPIILGSPTHAAPRNVVSKTHL
jgi:hypothetical protein